jgi:hypothetical protein
MKPGIPAEAYPLTWPPGRPRTPAHQRARAKFHAQTRENVGGWNRVERKPISLAVAVDELMGELRRLGISHDGANVVLSTNLRLRRDGLPYSDQRRPDDPGAAVYFRKDDRELCFACDRWDRVEDNIVAVAKTIEALRGIDRWGTGDMVQAAFTGFQAIAAAPARRAWWVVFGVEAHTPTADVEERYRELARQHHPDRGGNADAMVEVNNAWEDFQRERGL